MIEYLVENEFIEVVLQETKGPNYFHRKYKVADSQYYDTSCCESFPFLLFNIEREFFMLKVIDGLMKYHGILLIVALREGGKPQRPTKIIHEKSC